MKMKSKWILLVLLLAMSIINNVFAHSGHQTLPDFFHWIQEHAGGSLFLLFLVSAILIALRVLAKK